MSSKKLVPKRRYTSENEQPRSKLRGIKHPNRKSLVASHWELIPERFNGCIGSFRHAHQCIMYTLMPHCIYILFG